MSKDKPQNAVRLTPAERRAAQADLARTIAEWEGRAAHLRALAKAGYIVTPKKECPDNAPVMGKKRRLKNAEQKVPSVPAALARVAFNAARKLNGLPPLPTTPSKERKSRNAPITTTGHLTPVGSAFVYVGVGTGGRVKIGMSAEPHERCAKLGIRLHLAHPVTAIAAKAVETEALRLLGQRVGDGEVVRCDPRQVVQAVFDARDIVARSMHADPDLTPEQARLWRIAAMQKEE